MSMKFHHIGLACPNIWEEIESITKIHEVIDISPIVFDKEQKAELCILKTSEGIVIELISGEQVENILKKRITYYHLCFETDDINSEVARLQDLGAFLVSDLKPAILFGNKQVAFLQVSYGLIELVQF
jgi:methylmalonyl-CoA/ethylmalonyl-CoA epimerase